MHFKTEFSELSSKEYLVMDSGLFNAAFAGLCVLALSLGISTGIFFKMPGKGGYAGVCCIFAILSLFFLWILGEKESSGKLAKINVLPEETSLRASCQQPLKGGFKAYVTSQDDEWGIRSKERLPDNFTIVKGKVVPLSP
jgi:hypothetical protein